VAVSVAATIVAGVCMAGESKSEAARDQHKAIGVDDAATAKPAFKRTTSPDAQWFPEAGLGLFVHWGISSAHGDIELSWGMMSEVPWDADNKHTITPNRYFALAERFKPDAYDPGKWLRAAKKAGYRYAVMTTRHHDGFAMWPSDYGDFGTKTYLNGRDLVKPFVDACRKNGLKVGLYYSPPDWHYNRQYMSFRYGDKPALGLDHEPITVPPAPSGWDDAYKAYIRGQVEELLTNYGKIDVLWFDGGPEAISIERIRELQPGIVVNNRMHGQGDFGTPEWNLPEEQLEGWWENCASWIGGWGYKKSEDYQSAAWMLERLVQVRSMGGNLLINVGPRPTGELPPNYYKRQDEVRTWMRTNRESVFGVAPMPKSYTCNVPVTTKGKTWYLHVLPGSPEEIVLGNVEKPGRVRALGNGNSPSFSYESRTLRIQVPKAQRSGLVDVVKVSWK
jgi:alpha-L-fucosidase